jgi:transposase
MVAEVRASYGSQWAAIEAVAAKLGIGCAETLRIWVRQAEVDTGQRAGLHSEEHAEIKQILKAASVFFAAELDRPPRRS